MRLLLKLLAVIVLAPLALVLLIVLAIAAIVGLPLLWERIVARYASPPKGGTAQS